MTTGIFGGSFDPVHKGHTGLARHIVESGLCDRVLLMVSPLNPLKADRPPVFFGDRLEMVRIAVSDIPGVEASDFEVSLPLPSYTYNTLLSLSKAFPGHRFRLIIGTDNWNVFDRWKNPGEILRGFSPIIYPRPGIELDPGSLPEGIDFLADSPEIAVSSTELRALLADPDATRPDLIDPKVWSYARSRRLYQK